nr:acyltransferase family protein [uncultured Albidiferax sp.]
MNSTEINPRKQPWADLCRVLAIFGVILIHACGASFYQYGKISEKDWLSSNLLDSFVRCSVPLFVMLSGALLLKINEEASTPLDIAKRISKVLVPLLFWNIIYLQYISYFNGKKIDWLSMLNQAPMYHLWFVYMIIGIYIFLPVLQAIFQIISNRRDLQIYLLILWLIINCLPIYLPLPLLSMLQQTSFLGYGGYFIIGGIITLNKNKKISTSLWTAIYLTSVAITFFLTWNSSKQVNSLVETAYLYFSFNVILAAIASFTIFSRIYINTYFSSVFRWISERSFLIFFIHVVILEKVNNQIIALNFNIPALISILLISAITFGICLAIASLLRLIPKSRFLLG